MASVQDTLACQAEDHRHKVMALNICIAKSMCVVDKKSLGRAPIDSDEQSFLLIISFGAVRLSS